MNDLLAIVGPTAIGKSRLALRLARTFGGEIVSADSRQVYRHMDIGTGKPTPEEIAAAPHHLIDIANPDEPFSLAQYQSLAYRTIAEIQQRGRLPLLVGGSGLYVWTVLEGWQVPPVPPDAELRRSLERKAAEDGVAALYETLMKVDPEAARGIDLRNVRRVIRALEVYQQTNTPFSRLRVKEAPSFNAFIVGLTVEREELYRCIDQRVDDMIQAGLVAEVEKLLNMGYNLDLPSMSGIGYRQVGLFLRGELTLEEAVNQIKFETHRVARHQYAWFRLKDERIHWFDAQRRPYGEIEAEVADFLGR